MSFGHFSRRRTLCGSAGVTGLVAIALATPAQGQALQPVVSACSGVQLPQSVVTDILDQAVVPLATGVDGVVGNLLGLNVLIPGLISITDFDTNLGNTLDAIAAGDPITLQVLDTDGNLISPTDACNVTADGFTLDTPAGIAIGGNQITGLGANGQTASAGDLSAIAFGNGATTSAGLAGAVAIGTGASVTAGNSVALGAGSVADRGALTGYTAPLLGGTYDSIGTVSVGAPGALRQITNVAPGTAATDAATVGQVQAVAGQVGALSDLAVQYTDTTRTDVALAGAGGTTISNVAAGTISAGSTEAINGSQLFATNQAIAALQPGGGSGLAVTYDDASFATISLGGGAPGTTITNVAAGALSATSDDAVNGAQLFATNQRLTTTETNVTNLQVAVDNIPVGYVADADGVTPSTTSTNTAAFSGAGGGAVRVTGVAAGTLTAGSTDAVNGAQLAATNDQVAQNTADITTINNNLAGSTVVAVQYSNPGTPTVSNGGTITNDVTLVGANAAQPVRLHNVANGTAATDATNLGQLQAGLNSTLVNANAYTDTRFGVVDNRVNQLTTRVDQIAFDLGEMDNSLRRARRDAFSGTAGAMAVAGLPQTIEAGRSMVGGGIGHYRGQTAFALGVSSTFSEGRGVVKAGGTLDTHGKGGFSAGAGFSF
ncbi:YadA-like family protein [Croceibacterium sp. TMG7-5b_MA50]|uniref:YadA-like family protein n=1 Tax=Croceibacterium sp. TMG7-5b_MA50 TaxID=3121290 RepID=UPI003221CD63